MRKTLLWIPPAMHAALWKNPPHILVTALQPRQAVAWRAANRWADPIDLIVFTDDTPPAGVPFRAFAPASGRAPHCVVNPPDLAVAALDSLREACAAFVDGAQLARAYYQAVTICAAALRGIRVAWVQPESDHSLGALHAAETTGFVSAYSQQPMIDSIGMLAAGNLSVSVKTLGSIKTGGLR